MQIRLAMSKIVKVRVNVILHRQQSCFLAQQDWMKQMLKDYELNQSTMSLFVDNKGTIDISKNPVQHSRTKHINIKHHFIRKLVEVVSLDYVKIEDQLTDILTKLLDLKHFEYIRSTISLCTVWWIHLDHARSQSTSLVAYKPKLWSIMRLPFWMHASNVFTPHLCKCTKEFKLIWDIPKWGLNCWTQAQCTR